MYTYIHIFFKGNNSHSKITFNWFPSIKPQTGIWSSGQTCWWTTGRLCRWKTHARNVTAEVEIVQKCDMISKMYGNYKLHIMHSLQSKGMEQWLDAHEVFSLLGVCFFGICSSESPFFCEISCCWFGNYMGTIILKMYIYICIYT